MEKETGFRLSAAVAVIGIIILLISAAVYLIGWDFISNPSVITGMFLVVFGSATIRKYWSRK